MTFYHCICPVYTLIPIVYTPTQQNNNFVAFDIVIGYKKVTKTEKNRDIVTFCYFLARIDTPLSIRGTDTPEGAGNGRGEDETLPQKNFHPNLVIS